MIRDVVPKLVLEHRVVGIHHDGLGVTVLLPVNYDMIILLLFSSITF